MSIPVKVPAAATMQAATLKLHMKVRDCFSAQLVDDQDRQIVNQEDGYVPSFMPGQHYGDYVILDIDVATGQVKNWKCDPRKLQDWVTSMTRETEEE